MYIPVPWECRDDLSNLKIPPPFHHPHPTAHGATRPPAPRAADTCRSPARAAAAAAAARVVPAAAAEDRRRGLRHPRGAKHLPGGGGGEGVKEGGMLKR